MAVEYEPMRSLIYVDVVKEDYRHKLKHWLHRYHIADSISQFGPYVTKYAFYPALPTPPEGERFGTIRMQLTEHYWMINPFQNASKVKKILDNYIKGLLEDSKKLTNIAQKQKNTELKTETDSLRQKMVTLDIVNRNLTKDKIEKLEKEEKLNKTEAEEYKKLTSE